MKKYPKFTGWSLISAGTFILFAGFVYLATGNLKESFLIAMGIEVAILFVVTGAHLLAFDTD